MTRIVPAWLMTNSRPLPSCGARTPIGAGIRFDPPKFLQPGDVVEVEVSGVGVLRNGVRAEQAEGAAA